MTWGLVNDDIIVFLVWPNHDLFLTWLNQTSFFCVSHTVPLTLHTYSLALCSQLYWVCLTVLVNECRVFGMLQQGGPSGHCRWALEVLWEKPLRSAMATGGLQHSTSSPCADLRKGNLGWRNRGVAPELFPEHSAYPVPPTRFHMTVKSLSVCVCVCRVLRQVICKYTFICRSAR